MRQCLIAFAIIGLFAAGCVSSGNKMDRQKIESQIQKGVTTRAEVEKNLGTPDYVSMLPDGRRTLIYRYFESQAKGQSFIPYAGMFVGGSNNKQQTLQIMISKNNLVEDYEFSEKATETSSNPFGAHTTEATPASAGN